MRTLVPFAAARPKTRLAEVLDPEERRAFARVMLGDVLAAMPDTAEPIVVATEPVDVDAPVEVDDRRLTPAVNDRLEPPTAVVMADLALATPTALRRLFDADGDVVVAPGRGGGTNALVVRTESFHVDYHGASIRDHRDIAEVTAASVSEVDSFRLATDVDEPADLVEVLLHGSGDAPAWLGERGFALTVEDARATVTRTASTDGN